MVAELPFAILAQDHVLHLQCLLLARLHGGEFARYASNQLARTAVFAKTYFKALFWNKPTFSCENCHRV